MTAAKKTKTIDQVVRLDDVQGLIPGPIHYETYVPRVIAGVADLDIFDHARKTQNNVLIYGPTGPGKTTAVRAYASKHQIPLVTIPCNSQVTLDQLFGTMRLSDTGEWVWQDGPVTTVARHGGVIDLQEVNLMHPRLAGVLHSALDSQRTIVLMDRGEVVRIHPDTLFTASYNPDYEGTRPLNQAFRNRFAIQLHWPYLRKVEEQLVPFETLLDIADSLREASATGEITTPVSTNMLMEFTDMAETLGFSFAVTNFLSHFSDEERPAIQQVMVLNRERLLSEMGIDDAAGVLDPEGSAVLH